MFRSDTTLRPNIVQAIRVNLGLATQDLQIETTLTVHSKQRYLSTSMMEHMKKALKTQMGASSSTLFGCSTDHGRFVEAVIEEYIQLIQVNAVTIDRLGVQRWAKRMSSLETLHLLMPAWQLSVHYY